MFGLKIGDTVFTKSRNIGWKSFQITLFETDKHGNTWAIMGIPKFLENFGHYGERMWLIAVNGTPCWKESIWLKK